jgi:hypothetical protein
MIGPIEDWWSSVLSHATEYRSKFGPKPAALVAARAARKAFALHIELRPRDALEMAWRAMLRAKYGSYLP